MQFTWRRLQMLLIYYLVLHSLWDADHNQFSKATYYLLWAGVGVEVKIRPQSWRKD
jgi:hypothetical protein